VALNEDEKKLLQELTDRANAPDEDDDFEIEVYDTAAGKGARIPYRKGSGWLHEVFGIGTPPAAAAPPEDETPPKGAGKGAEGGAYFGRGAKK
jgi:hypothetical protein